MFRSNEHECHCLSRARPPFTVTVEEGLDHLKTLGAMEVQVACGGVCLRLPTPRNGILKVKD